MCNRGEGGGGVRFADYSSFQKFCHGIELRLKGGGGSSVNPEPPLDLPLEAKMRYVASLKGLHCLLSYQTFSAEIVTWCKPLSTTDE